MLPSRIAQIRHRHDLDYQARPAGKMLCPLSSACFRVVLLPCEACSFPFVEDVFYKVFAQGGVDFRGLGFVLAGLGCDVLGVIFSHSSSNLLS